jgi:hypothetical protein
MAPIKKRKIKDIYNMNPRYETSLYQQITNSKYFVATQGAGVIFGSFFIITALISLYVLPITSPEETFVVSFLLFFYVYLLKSYWVEGDDIRDRGRWVLRANGLKYKKPYIVENSYRFKNGSFAEIIYTIIGIPFPLLIAFSLMISFGWMTIYMKSYEEHYDNTFDKVMVVYVSPIVSIIIIGYVVINTLLKYI